MTSGNAMMKRTELIVLFCEAVAQGLLEKQKARNLSIRAFRN